MNFKDRKTTAFLFVLAVIFFSLITGCADEKNKEQPVAAGTMSAEEIKQLKQHGEAGRKIIFVGIDAADWDIIRPLMDQGLMPNMKKIVDNGAWGRLESFGATASPIVWTTIATGKMPEKHGITTFVVKDENSSESRPIDRTYRKTKAIWNIVSDFGLKAGVIDWQVSFPPERVNGYVIAHLMHNEKIKSNPPEEQECFEREVDLTRQPAPSGASTWDKIIRYHKHDLESVEAVGLAMQRRHEVDFFAVYTHAIDEIQHQFWKFKAPEKFQDPVWELNADDVAKYHSVIDDFNIRADEMIGRFMKPGHTIVVVSDHGSAPQQRKRTYLQMNRILETMGFVAFREGSADEVDFSRTRAYEGGFDRWNVNIGISINLKDREPNGIVPPESYDETLNDLVDILASARIVETEKPLFEQVAVLNEFEDKDQISSKVDVVIVQDKATFFADLGHHISLGGHEYPLADFLKFDTVSGDHAKYGIIAAMGEGIRRGKIDGAKMADVTPTLLYMMGLPVGKDMDGDVLKNMFTAQYLQSNPILYVDSHDNLGERFVVEESRGTSTADEEIKDKLRALGYIN